MSINNNDRTSFARLSICFSTPSPPARTRWPFKKTAIHGTIFVKNAPLPSSDTSLLYSHRLRDSVLSTISRNPLFAVRYQPPNWRWVSATISRTTGDTTKNYGYKDCKDPRDPRTFTDHRPRTAVRWAEEKEENREDGRFCWKTDAAPLRAPQPSCTPET